MARKGDGKRHRTPKETVVRAGGGTPRSADGSARLHWAPGTGKATDKPITLTPRVAGDSDSSRQPGKGAKSKKRPQPGFGW